MKRDKNWHIVTGAGLGMIFGYALWNAGIGLVIGAAVGLSIFLSKKANTDNSNNN